MVLVGISFFGQLERLTLSILGQEIDLILSAPVRDKGDPAAVRRPLCIPLMNAGCGCQVSRVAVLGRNRKDVAPRAKRARFPSGEIS